MKKQLTIGLQILAVVAAVAILITSVRAYTNPTGTPPSGDVPAPVNTGTVMQTKQGDLGLGGTGTGNLFASMGIFSAFGSIGPTSGGTLTGGLSVDPLGNVSIFGPLRIASGSPAAGDVLTSDASGNATWQPATAGSGSSPLPTLNYSTFTVEANGGGATGNIGTVMCPSGSILVGGGASCDSSGYLTQSAPISTTGSGLSSGQQYNGWGATCLPYYRGGGVTNYPAVHEYAICLSASVSASAGGSGGTGTGGTWTQASGTGTTGDSCATAFGSHTYEARQTSPTSLTTSGDCAYLATSNSTCVALSSGAGHSGYYPVGSCTYVGTGNTHPVTTISTYYQ